MHSITDALIGDWHRAEYASVKAFLLFATAVLMFRLTERRTMAVFAPFDWVDAAATGAIVGRTATATDASWLTGTAALAALLLAHTALARLRFLEPDRRFVDPPLRVLVCDGEVDARSLRRCGLTGTDLRAVLRQHGQLDLDGIHLAIFEARGRISVLSKEAAVGVPIAIGHRPPAPPALGAATSAPQPRARSRWTGFRAASRRAATAAAGRGRGPTSGRPCGPVVLESDTLLRVIRHESLGGGSALSERPRVAARSGPRGRRRRAPRALSAAIPGDRVPCSATTAAFAAVIRSHHGSPSCRQKRPRG
ncbi:MAG: DUF421 domain-containing protein [Kineosporiaceae bacterium]